MLTNQTGYGLIGDEQGAMRNMAVHKTHQYNAKILVKKNGTQELSSEGANQKLFNN